LGIEICNGFWDITFEGSWHGLDVGNCEDSCSNGYCDGLEEKFMKALTMVILKRIFYSILHYLIACIFWNNNFVSPRSSVDPNRLYSFYAILITVIYSDPWMVHRMIQKYQLTKVTIFLMNSFSDLVLNYFSSLPK